jgi:hypothetical protein
MVGYPKLDGGVIPDSGVMLMLLPKLEGSTYSFDAATLDTDDVKLLERWVTKYTNRGLPKHLASGESRTEVALRQRKLLHYYGARRGGADGSNPIIGGRLKKYTVHWYLGANGTCTHPPTHPPADMQQHPSTAPTNMYTTRVSQIKGRPNKEPNVAIGCVDGSTPMVWYGGYDLAPRPQIVRRYLETGGQQNDVRARNLLIFVTCDSLAGRGR